MQISAANLLASQSQTVRPRPATTAAFEPIAFKQTPPSAVTQENARQPAASPEPTPSAAAPGGYVRPGTTLDIKI
jgi:hypothetical protein